MSNERFTQRKTEFLKAISRLEEACAQPETSFIRDSVIQRFEFTWELVWKMLKLRLTYLGVEALNPREVMRQAAQFRGLCVHQKLWYGFATSISRHS